MVKKWHFIAAQTGTAVAVVQIGFDMLIFKKNT